MSTPIDPDPIARLKPRTAPTNQTPSGPQAKSARELRAIVKEIAARANLQAGMLTVFTGRQFFVIHFDARVLCEVLGLGVAGLNYFRDDNTVAAQPSLLDAEKQGDGNE